MVIAKRGSISPAGFVLVSMLHAGILYFLLQDNADMTPAPNPRYSRLLFILEPARPVAAEPPPRLAIPSPIKPVPRLTPEAKRPLESVAIAAMPERIESPVSFDQDDSPATPKSLNIEDLVRQAGKADRETRPANERQAYGPAADSMEAVMTKAFTAAKLAVPLKWYEAARIELFSAPNDPKKIYQVKTAFGTYCLFYPSIYEEVGGGAAARQPKMSSCPKRFGAGAK